MTPRPPASIRPFMPARADAAASDRPEAARLRAPVRRARGADTDAAASDRPEGRRPTASRRAAARRDRPTAPLLAAAALAGAVLAPAAADAQVGGYVSFNGGTQATSTAFDDNIVFPEFQEDADFNAAYGVGGGAVFDVGGGLRLANGLGFGMGVSRFERVDPASIDARVPHPFFFDRPRSLNGSAPDLTRRETAVHLEVRWFAPAGDAVELSVFGGPTFFSLRQHLVTAIAYDHSYPYDEATFGSASTTALSASAVGFHAGADVGFFFSEAVGVGALLRYSAASVDLPADAGAIPVDAGGFHVGAGLRLRF